MFRMTTFDGSNNSIKNGNEKKRIDVDSLLSKATRMIDPVNEYLNCVISIRDSVKSDSKAKIHSLLISKIQPIVKKHSGVLLKTITDDIFLYFHDKPGTQDLETIEKGLECCLAIISVRNDINKELAKEQLPEISYNISADYFNFMFTAYEPEKPIPFQAFRRSINVCREMNKLAPVNSMIIGQDLKIFVQRIPVEKGYRFEKLQDYQRRKKSSYPVFLFSKEELVKKEN